MITITAHENGMQGDPEEFADAAALMEALEAECGPDSEYAQGVTAHLEAGSTEFTVPNGSAGAHDHYKVS